MDKHYQNLLLAFEEAEKARDEGTFPIGAIIVDADGSVAEWNNSRGYTDNHWNDELVNEIVQ
ncbi:hypothetical protein [Paenibacillus sp. M2]|uniref:hypothetical protein n=1 Tax=Paenibacillus sp. M2 TaxID=3341793 RepID=UPI0039891CB9